MRVAHEDEYKDYRSIERDREKIESKETRKKVRATCGVNGAALGHEHGDLPRLSLDSDEPSILTRSSHRNTSTISRVRVVKPRALFPENPNTSTTTRVVRSPMQRAPESTAQACGVSADSPRMNSSGKVVFNNLERSSSSSSSFNGGPRYKHRGMERSYLANVRVTPVLNVPICSLRGSSKYGVFGHGVFGLFSSQRKKESSGASSSSNGGFDFGSEWIGERLKEMVPE
ncbi:Hypothetical predicted protein [Olea europaea subsp. europaea]|uniref:Uncharacterized protein n=1 Tax=Olea europaea subsp. europaea TaxID=158383 RepID=A0A8S0SKB4_OLEEU|nr:Hypothetical predicted protein [Olea europaea subsp. europaea]